MEKHLHEEIVYLTDISLINSPAFYDCCVHLICNSGSARFKYNVNSFELIKDEIAVISRPKLISEFSTDEDFSCEILVAPDKFLHNLLPANNYAIQGSLSLFDNPVITVSPEDADRFRHDISLVSTKKS